MAAACIPRKRTQGTTKVKTGCATCRIRKVKCDESKPSCQRCVKTGRACDGYESPFRLCTGQPVHNSQISGIKPEGSLQLVRYTASGITPQDIEYLGRCFSTKTVFDGVKLSCNDEAQQLLQASLTNTSIRHAISSLRALRQDFEAGGTPTSMTPSYNYGLQQYGRALNGLASALSSPGTGEVYSALLCCQMFISIEQLQGNFAAMAQHIIRGLGILHESHARPRVAANRLIPARRTKLPLLDAFIVKLFAAPCKFSERPAPTADVSGTTAFPGPETTHQPPDESRRLRTIAPDMRAELTRVSTLTLAFLNNVSQVTSMEAALPLLVEKAGLLHCLESWLCDLELLHNEGASGPEPLAVTFMRLFHVVLKIVLLRTLDCSSALDDKLRIEHGRLQGLANNVGQRVKVYYRLRGRITSS